MKICNFFKFSKILLELLAAPKFFFNPFVKRFTNHFIFRYLSAMFASLVAGGRIIQLYYIVYYFLWCFFFGADRIVSYFKYLFNQAQRGYFWPKGTGISWAPPKVVHLNTNQKNPLPTLSPIPSHSPISTSQTALSTSYPHFIHTKSISTKIIVNTTKTLPNSMLQNIQNPDHPNHAISQIPYKTYTSHHCKNRVY